MNRVEELKAISDDADKARDIARKAYDTYRNARIGNYDYFAASDIRDAYNAAEKTASAAWDAYNAAKKLNN